MKTNVTKPITLFVLVLMSMVLLAGCQPVSAPATPTPAQEPTATSSPVVVTYPGDDWGYPSPFTFYPRGPGYLRMSFIFDTLTWKDEQGVISWLADSWEVSEDGTKWTFRLHPGVKWHDGEDVTVEDVAFTFEYFKGHRADFKWSSPVEKVIRTEIIDEQTCALHLTEPIAGFLVDVAGSIPIIPKHIWKDVEDPAKFTSPKAVVGTGPFMLEEYSKEEGRYVYRANPDYFKGKPKVDMLAFIKVNDPALALKTGTVDAASFWSKEIEAVKNLQAESQFKTIEGPSFWVLQIIFNAQRPPFNKVEVRRAIAHAINRDQIVEKVTHGGAIVANLGIMSPKTDWYDPNLPTYDYAPEKAREMLSQAGVEDLSLTILTTGSFAREAELIKADLKEVGIQAEVKAADRSTVDGLLREGQFDLAVSGHGAIANPSFLSSPTWPAAVWKNEEYDTLFAEQACTVNEAKRRQFVWQLQQILADDLPVLTLYHPKMWCVYDPAKLDTWFYTAGGISIGIPIELNKLVFLER